MVEFSPFGRKQNRRGGFHIRPCPFAAAQTSAGAYRMRPYGIFLSDAIHNLYIYYLLFIIYYLLFIIYYFLFVYKTFHFCGTNSSSNRRVANSSLMPLM